MHPRAAELIRTLGLAAHPEGGYYRELYRSATEVGWGEPPRSRAAGTSIYFLLVAGEISRLHVCDADETWHFYEGDPLEVHVLSADDRAPRVLRLAAAGDREGGAPFAWLEAGAWQAARTTGRYTLVGCGVAPGFEFAGFRMLERDSAEGRELLARHPTLEPFA